MTSSIIKRAKAISSLVQDALLALMTSLKLDSWSQKGRKGQANFEGRILSVVVQGRPGDIHVEMSMLWNFWMDLQGPNRMQRIVTLV